MSGIEQITVGDGEAGMRLDRWFKSHYPGLGFGHLQKLLRSGQVRLDGGRAKSDTRVQPGQTVRIPPLGVDKANEGPLTAKTIRAQDDGDVLAKMLLHEDDKVFVFDKPSGLAVQGGSGLVRHVDGMLEAWRNKKGEKPRLVHRLDRDTSGVLVVARTRLAAMKLAESFRARETKKTYWALVRGVPRERDGRISSWLIKEATPDGDRVRVAQHGEKGADHAVSHYRVVERAGQELSWLEMEPYTGRTHQLRVHAAELGSPIIGDPKYFEADQNWTFPGGLQNRLHLHARRIVIPHPDRGTIDVTAPLPPHMRQSWSLLGFDEKIRGTLVLTVVPFERRDAVDAAAAAIMVFLTFFWGLNGVAAKLANTGYDPLLVVAIRSALGGALVVGWCAWRGIPLFERDGSLWPGILAGLLFGAEFVLIYIGLEFTTVGRSALLVNTMPFWVLLGAHFFLGEPMSRRAVGGLTLAFIGVGVIFSDRLGTTNPNAIIGDLMSLAAGVAWGSTTIVIKRTKLAVISAEKLLLYQLLLAALLALVILPFSGSPIRDGNLVATGALLFQAVFIVAITYLLWMWVLRRYPAGGLSSFIFLTPAFSVLCGAAILGEPLTIRILLSLVLIAVGLFIVNRPSRKPSASPI